MGSAAQPDPDLERLAALQARLRALESSADGGDPQAAAERGVRLRLVRQQLDENVRAARADRQRREHQELDRALNDLLERVASRPSPPPQPPPPVVLPRPRPKPITVTPPPPPPTPRLRPKPQRRRYAPDLPVHWSPTAPLGFRMWEMRGRLQGVFKAWSGPAYRAGCVTRRGELDDPDVPHSDGSCGFPPCGIYATKEPADLVAEFGLPEGQRRYVYGLVALSGKVVEHERGYRAREARVVAAAVIGRGMLVRVEGEHRVRRLFTAPPQEVGDIIGKFPTAVTQVPDLLTGTEALVAYLSEVRLLHEAAF